MYETRRSWTLTGATQRHWMTEIGHERTRRIFRESSDIRQEMLHDLGLEADDVPDSGMFSGVVEEVREDENLRQPASDHAYVPFETNLPLDVGVDDTERDHQIGRLVRTYARRWGIENGFKKVKTFLPDTTSPEAAYRYFNFAFACTLYNVWRLVDLLVKLELRGDPDYAPLVTAPEFVTLTKRMGWGLDPPVVRAALVLAES